MAYKPFKSTSLKFQLSVWEASTVCLVICAGLYLFSRTVADPDLWGHVKFGRDIWLSGQVSREDSYSYLTGDQSWINHEWLAETIFYLVFAVGGTPGLIALKTVISVFILVRLFSHLRRQGLTPPQAGISLMLAVLIFLPYLVLIRPQAFTFLFFLLLLLIVYKTEEGNSQYLWFVPPIFALWANLHGGFLAGIGILLIWSAANFIPDVVRNGSVKTVPYQSNLIRFSVLLVAILASLLNPYGTELLAFLLRTATVPRREIGEWQPLKIMSPEGFIYLPLLVVSSIGLLYSRKKRKPALVVLFLAVCFLPHVASRHLPLFALGALVLTAEHIADVWKRYLPSPSGGSTTTAVLPSQRYVIIFTFLLSILLVGFSPQNFRCIRLSPGTSVFPARAIQLLKNSGASGNLAIDFGWGEYALWYLAPQIKISVDGRRETVYSDKVYNQTMAFTSALGEWDSILAKGQTDMALLSKGFPVFNLMKLKPDWVVLYEDPAAGVFARKGAPAIQRIQSTKIPDVPYDGAGLCFP
jgi:hypothetical protein